MRAWYENLAERERRMVLLGGVVAVPVGLDVRVHGQNRCHGENADEGKKNEHEEEPFVGVSWERRPDGGAFARVRQSLFHQQAL